MNEESVVVVVVIVTRSRFERVAAKFVIESIKDEMDCGSNEADEEAVGVVGATEP